MLLHLKSPNSTKPFYISATTTRTMFRCKWERKMVELFIYTTIAKNRQTFVASTNACIITSIATQWTLRECTHFIFAQLYPIRLVGFS